jgi:hypothetical protein
MPRGSGTSGSITKKSAGRRIGCIDLVGQSIEGVNKMQEEKDITNQIIRYRNNLLEKARGKILGAFLDKPIDDFTEYEEGFEAGLAAAITIVQELKIK